MVGWAAHPIHIWAPWAGTESGPCHCRLWLAAQYGDAQLASASPRDGRVPNSQDDSIFTHWQTLLVKRAPASWPIGLNLMCRPPNHVWLSLTWKLQCSKKRWRTLWRLKREPSKISSGGFVRSLKAWAWTGIPNLGEKKWKHLNKWLVYWPKQSKVSRQLHQTHTHTQCLILLSGVLSAQCPAK